MMLLMLLRNMLSSIAIALRYISQQLTLPEHTFFLRLCFRSAALVGGYSDVTSPYLTLQASNTDSVHFLARFHIIAHFEFLMLVENVTPVANQPESWAVGQPLVTLECSLSNLITFILLDKESKAFL
eukprot:1138578-Pelagomonas_calceolata.AAC.1